MGIYLATLFAVFFLVYKPAKVPPYALVFLVLSKRLHSIYMLRMFNDVCSTFLVVLAIALLQRRQWTFSSLMLSAAVSVKMNSLLYLPGAAIIYLQVLGPIGAFIWTAIPFLLVQIGVAFPFITAGFQKEYISQAFEFSRVFLYKWTVNWRFVPESIFLSKYFSIGLLTVHLSLIMLFCLRKGYHWLTPIKVPKIFVPSATSEFSSLVRALLFPSPIELSQRAIRVTPDYVLTTLATSNLIGILCARSLHYQFYSWFFWLVPFVLSKVQGVVGPFVSLAIYATQEQAWNVYPSTNQSSGCVVFSLFAMVVGLWIYEYRVAVERERRELLQHNK